MRSATPANAGVVFCLRRFKFQEDRHTGMSTDFAMTDHWEQDAKLLFF